VDGDDVLLRQFGQTLRVASADIVAYQLLNPI
jgi:hypothetical protein